MARIPQAEIERLKSEVSGERLVTAAGIELKRAGKDLIARCPFHEVSCPSVRRADLKRNRLALLRFPAFNQQ